MRLLTKEDIEQRNLSLNTTGVVIVEIDQDSPADYLKINNIIVEAQKKKIKTITFGSKSGNIKIIKNTYKQNKQIIKIDAPLPKEYLDLVKSINLLNE